MADDLFDDTERELLEAEALAQECDTPEAWDEKVSKLVDNTLGVKPEVSQSPCSFCPCPSITTRHGYFMCAFHRDNGRDSGACPDCIRRSMMTTPEYIAQGHKVEPAHPVAQPIEIPVDLPSAILSPPIKDDSGDYDAEYQATFNGAVALGLGLEPEQSAIIRHRLLNMIRRAKIIESGLRVTEEGKVAALDNKKRVKDLQDSETAFRARHKAAPAPDKVRAPRKPPTAAQAMSAVEKQIKSFLKLGIDDEPTLRDSLTALKFTVPDDLAAVIAKLRK